MRRRLVAGVILIGQGLWLLSSQMPATPERLVFGLAMLAAWGVVGVAVVARLSWSRFAGLAVSAVGVVGAFTTLSMTGDITSPNARLIAELFNADGTFSWIGIAIDALIFAVLSAVAAVLLVPPLEPRQQTHDVTADA